MSMDIKSYTYIILVCFTDEQTEPRITVGWAGHRDKSEEPVSILLESKSGLVYKQMRAWIQTAINSPGVTVYRTGISSNFY